MKQLIRSENPLDAATDYQAWKRGEISDAQYFERMRLRSLPPVVEDAPGYRAAAWRAAGKGKLTTADLAHLERTKGSSDAK